MPLCLCGNLSNFLKNIISYIQASKNRVMCQVYWIRAILKYGIYNKIFYYFPVKGDYKNQSYFVHFHNKSFFRLAKVDYKSVSKASTTWFTPLNTNIASNVYYTFEFTRE